MEQVVARLVKQSARVAFCVLAVVVLSGADGFAQNGKITTAKEYYDTGELKAVYNFFDGEKQGPARLYHKNGTLKEDLKYKNGRLDGVARFYDERGQVTEIREYSKDEIVSSGEGLVQVDEVPDEQPAALRLGGDGNSEEQVAAFIRPPPADELQPRLTKAPENSEETKTYYETGELEGTFRMVDGKKNGPARTYFKNGNVKEILNYANDLLDGMARKYYEDGTLHQEARFVGGQLEGPARIYGPQGQPQEEKIYADNQVIVAPEAEVAPATEEAAVDGETPPAEIAKIESNSEETPESEDTSENSEEPRWDFELGYDTSSYVYKEPTVMRMNGMMHGVVGSVTRRQKFTHIEDFEFESWFNLFKLDARYSWGQVDYKGRLSSGTPYNVNKIDDFVLETRLMAGHDFEEFEPVVLTAYTGIGFRYLLDNLGKDSAGYDRESRYVYCPIGVDVTKPLSNGWSIGGNVEFDGLLGGWQVSHLSQFDPGYSNLENEQDTGYGVRASFRFMKKGEKLSFVLEPFFRYWSIEESDPSPIIYRGSIITSGPNYLVAYEPDNNTTEYGVKLLTRF